MEFWLKTQARENNEKIFLDDGSTQLTFGEAYDYTTRLAHTLTQLKRTRLGLYIDISIESVLLINSCWLAGIETAMINTRLTDREIQSQMASVNVETIITMEQFELAGLTIIPYKTLQSQMSSQQFEFDFSFERIASIMFTSGTTGPQKAVPQTFANHYASALGCKESLGFNAETKWLSVLPIYHISGLSVILRALIGGFTVRLESKFVAERMLQIIQEEQPTHVSLVPQTLKWLMNEGLTQPHSIEKILLGGAKLSSSLIERALQYHLPIYNSFGMTETCSQFLTASSEMLATRHDTVGQTSENVDVKIKNPNHQGHGELLVKGNNVMDGYLYPENSNNAFEDGYFNTGDIAEITEEGYVMVYDRRKDLIISGGENIYPYQIETIAKSHHLIEDAVCVGVKDETWGEVPSLYYVAEVAISDDTLKDYFKENLAKYKIPKFFHRISSLPYTSTGKLQRNQLKN